MDCSVLSYVFRVRKAIISTNHFISQIRWSNSEYCYQFCINILENNHSKNIADLSLAKDRNIKGLTFLNAVCWISDLNWRYKTAGYKMIMTVLTDRSFQWKFKFNGKLLSASWQKLHFLGLWKAHNGLRILSLQKRKT